MYAISLNWMQVNQAGHLVGYHLSQTCVLAALHIFIHTPNRCLWQCQSFLPWGICSHTAQRGVSMCWPCPPSFPGVPLIWLHACERSPNSLYYVGVGFSFLLVLIIQGELSSFSQKQNIFLKKKKNTSFCQVI